MFLCKWPVIHPETGRDSHSQKPVSPADVSVTSVNPILRSLSPTRSYTRSVWVTPLYVKRGFYYWHIVTFSLWDTNEIINNFVQGASSETQGQSVGLGEKAWKSFQAWAEEPLGTDSQQTISKRSSECWLPIGHKSSRMYREQSQNLFLKFELIDPPVLSFTQFFQCTIKIKVSSLRTKFYSE